jgi:glycosyltransferase involved in cell wall biosynthesis
LTMRVLIHPDPHSDIGEGGIQTVLRAYVKHFPKHGIEIVKPGDRHDLVVSHAGAGVTDKPDAPLVAHCHGLYWTAGFNATDAEYGMNAQVIHSLRLADEIIVPSNWVAETLKRELRMSPWVIGHGIDWEDWQQGPERAGYVLWNKNRPTDACDPSTVNLLASRAPSELFVTTFAAPKRPDNVLVCGPMAHADMKVAIQRAGVYLATTKETYGIGILEAMAAGVPVLGFDWGGARDLVHHGVTGYLAAPNDYEDLLFGLHYCRHNAAELGDAAKEAARLHDWGTVVETMRDTVFVSALAGREPTSVAIVIPAYNTGRFIADAIDSALSQTRQPDVIVVVDNGSTDDTLSIAKRYEERSEGLVKVIQEGQKGVAHARNAGIAAYRTKYVCCLDSDDSIEPEFLEMLLPYLETHPLTGIAYSGLKLLHGDGHTVLSPWPSEYDYSRQLEGFNQVPTCCVFRREAWERVGGYRQRYAPTGAGTEDAEFWLRLGAYGYGGKRVTPAPLFTYRAGAGITARPDYQEVDWTAWHPWTKDGQHPFASVAKPRHMAHDVRNYDMPLVSVVIPCGPGHTKHLVDALDSLEAQTLRRWEAIVVFNDGESRVESGKLMRAYPYVRTMYTNGPVGAGAARNIGARLAQAPYLLFLDADDWLKPQALASLLTAAIRDESIAYSDYLGHAFIDADLAQKMSRAGRLLEYRQGDGQAVIAYRAADYDCERALRQPEYKNGEFYIWNLVSSLVRKDWHEEIGGFDEGMESWEDWDYWLRLARAGKCFSRVPLPLVEYRFYTGNRREDGRQLASYLVEYLTDKLGRETAMPCGGCSKRKTTKPALTIQTPMLGTFGGTLMSSSDMVLVQLNDGNQGQHPIVGSVTRTNYGYRATGDQFLITQRDYEAMADRFNLVETVKVEEIERIEKVAAVRPHSVAAIPGARPSTVKLLEEAGITTVPAVIAAGKSGLMAVEGIGERTATDLLEAAKNMRKTE